ncbi:hypothetical protein FNF29_02460 [Cafeteria roenbergensis]|uniref:Uncharacterized protein n=1 Tax=Cafeteria roenbergensis TaxID=33653 RepID=A0A5A8CNC4_CAFRO|nr:hypothetical protein FNF29_02460 [Cafeteria roenbergensis]|eukprot:KAA0154238.1 hypothetical protein FNF29_02460 [Cafeteria roenbergensis]
MSGALSIRRATPKEVLTRVPNAEEAIQFFQELRVADGLKSTGEHKDFYALLGQLGTASGNIKADAPIEVVLRKAEVALEETVDVDQLTKWHRLGHLRGVAGKAATNLAEPSTMKTVRNLAKHLLEEAEEQEKKAKREAEEQEALRSQMLKTLAIVDSSISAIPSDSLSEAAATMHKYTPDKAAELDAEAGLTALAKTKACEAFADRICNIMRSEHGVGPALEAAGLNPEMMSVLKDQVASSRRPASGPGEVCEFLEANKLNMLLVMDEADEPYKKFGNIIARELDQLRGRSPQMIYYVSGSAAAMRDILFNPDRVNTGVYDVEKFWSKKNHDEKLVPLAPLEPLSSLEDHAKAIVAAGSAFSNFYSDATRFLANSTVAEERARFGKTVLRAGSVLRALLGQPGAHSEKPPLGLDKMQRDIIATQHGRQLSSVFAAHFKSVITGLCPETVLDQLVSPSVGFPALGLDIGKLSARLSEDSGEAVAAEALMPPLSILSDCGVLTLADAKWQPVSWTAVLSILLVDEGRLFPAVQGAR